MKTRIDKMGEDDVGVDEVGEDEMEVGKVGRHSWYLRFMKAQRWFK